MGTWAQNIGQSWLVLSITDSPMLLGILSVVQFTPVMLFSLFAGVFIDKLPKKKIIIVTQIVSMILALILSALVFTETVQYWHVLILAAVLGLTNTFDMPARQAFIIELVGKKDVMNAVALNSATFNLARILGPAMGAVLIGYVGIGWCFLLNGISFIAVLIGLFNIKVLQKNESKTIKGNILKDIKEGVKYIFSDRNLLNVIAMVLVMGIFAYNFNILIPVFTKSVLGMEEKAYGFLLSALGTGSFIGAITASVRSKKGPITKLLFISSLLIGTLLTLTGLTREYYLTALMLLITGVFNILFSTTANSTLQLNAKNEFRGRVMSIYSLVFVGSAPIGSFLSGLFSEKLGAGATFVINGIAVVVLTVVLRLAVKVKKRAELVDN
jgi:predicted MFS family arabinose efflux permease